MAMQNKRKRWSMRCRKELSCSVKCMKLKRSYQNQREGQRRYCIVLYCKSVNERVGTSVRKISLATCACTQALSNVQCLYLSVMHSKAFLFVSVSSSPRFCFGTCLFHCPLFIYFSGARQLHGQ